MGKLTNLTLGVAAGAAALGFLLPSALNAREASGQSTSSPASSRLGQTMENRIEGMRSRPLRPGTSFGSDPVLLESLRRGARKAARPARMAASDGVIYGCLAYTDEWGANLGVYSFGLDDSGTKSLVEPNIRANGGGTYANGKYYYCEYVSADDVYTFIFDAETWDLIRVGDGDITIVAHDMDYDPVSGKIYGSFIGDSGTEWGELNMGDYTRTKIATMNPGVHAVAFNATGQAYGVGFDGNLYKVNKNTGECTLVGPTGLQPYYDSSAAIDKASGRMFYTLSTDGVSGLYEINTSTGAATLVTRFHQNEEVCGLYFPDTPVSPTAPAMASDLSLDFASGALTGKLNFTAPTKSFGGGTLSGVLNYTVSMDGQRMALGTANPGEKVSVPVTVDASGMYNFIVNTSNVGGNGQPAYFNGYIGHAAPEAPTAVNLLYQNDRFVLDWKGSSKAATEGAFNASGITYTVKRYPGGEVAAEGLTGTTFSEDAQISSSGSQYYYTVEAVNGDAYSVPAESNRLTLQIIVPPYLETFDSKHSIDAWTIYGYSGCPTTWDWFGDEGISGKIRIQGRKDYVKDEWAFTPGIRLEAGHIYTFSLDTWVWNHKYGEEYLSVVVSDEPSDEGNVSVLIPKTRVMAVTAPGEPGTVDKFTADYQCTKSGVYYFGLHGEAAKDAWMLEVDNVSVGAAQVAAAPAAVDDLTVTPGSEGALTAKVEFTAPVLSIRGEKLDELDAMTVMRDGQTVKTFTNPAMGEKLSFDDSGLSSGLHTYSVVGHNSYGNGNSAAVTAFIGINAPKAPETVDIVETANDGEVTLSWPAVTVDRDGRPLNTSDVTYIISDNGDIISSNVKGTSYTFRAIPANGNQQFVSYTVYAMTSAGRSPGSTNSAAIPVGPAYSTPYVDSFEEGGYTHINNVSPVNTQLPWKIWHVDDMELETPDGDLYMLAARGSNVGQNSMWATGKIRLGDDISALSFYYYGMTECENFIDVKINDGSGWTTLRHIVLGSPQAWRKEMIHLPDYAGKTVQIGFDGTVMTHTMIILDAIRLEALPPVNLTADAIRVPARVDAGQDVKVEVDVINNGSKATDGYSVDIYRNGRKVGNVAGMELASGEKTTLTFSEPAAVTSSTLVYRGEIVCADDADSSDNSTFEATAHVALPNYPSPSELTAVKAGETVELDWKGVNLETQLPDAVTDDFEAYEAFAVNEAGEWNFIDADGSKTYGFQGIDFPHAGEPMAYIVFNNEGSQFDNFFNTVSGHQFMASFVTYGGQNDDWMISPRLFGSAQTISLFAKTYNDYYGLESFEILYSIRTRSKGDFTLLESVEDVPTDWTEYSFDLPDGARYVAVRCTSQDRMMFMLDDFTYVPYGAEVDPLQFVGYNVYRDEEKLNETPVLDCYFTDNLPLSKQHVYCVTAVYDRGESAPSNFVSLGTSGADESAVSAPRAYVADGFVVVENVAGRDVVVSAVDGYTVYSSRAASDIVRVPVAKGVYVVTVDGRSVKLIQ